MKKNNIALQTSMFFDENEGSVIKLAFRSIYSYLWCIRTLVQIKGSSHTSAIENHPQINEACGFTKEISSFKDW